MDSELDKLSDEERKKAESFEFPDHESPADTQGLDSGDLDNKSVTETGLELARGGQVSLPTLNIELSSELEEEIRLSPFLARLNYDSVISSFRFEKDRAETPKESKRDENARARLQYYRGRAQKLREMAGSPLNKFRYVPLIIEAIDMEAGAISKEFAISTRMLFLENPISEAADVYESLAGKWDEAANRYREKADELRSLADTPIGRLWIPTLLLKAIKFEENTRDCDLDARSLRSNELTILEGGKPETRLPIDRLNNESRELAESLQADMERIDKCLRNPLYLTQRAWALETIEKSHLRKQAEYHPLEKFYEYHEFFSIDFKTKLEFEWLVTGWKEGKEWHVFKELNEYYLEKKRELEEREKQKGNSEEISDFNSQLVAMDQFIRKMKFLLDLGEELKKHSADGTVDQFIEESYRQAAYNDYVESWRDQLRLLEHWRKMNMGNTGNAALDGSIEAPEKM